MQHNYSNDCSRVLKRKWLLNRNVFIFASSSFPEHSTLGDASGSFPEHSTLGDAKSNISIRVRLGFSFGFFFTVRLRSSYCVIVYIVRLLRE